MKKRGIWAVCLLIGIILCGCKDVEEQPEAVVSEPTVATVNGVMKITVSDPNKKCNEIIQTVYTDEQLLALSDALKNGDIDNIMELNQAYPVECLRIFFDSTGMYNVIYRSEHHMLDVLVLERSKQGRNPRDIHCSENNLYQNVRSSEELDAITVGTTLEQVKQLDPGGDYWNTGRWETINDFNYSTHFTSDGYQFRVYYNQNSVTKVEKTVI